MSSILSGFLKFLLQALLVKLGHPTQFNEAAADQVRRGLLSEPPPPIPLPIDIVDSYVEEFHLAPVTRRDLVDALSEIGFIVAHVPTPGSLAQEVVEGRATSTIKAGLPQFEVGDVPVDTVKKYDYTFTPERPAAGDVPAVSRPYAGVERRVRNVGHVPERRIKA